MPKVTQLFHARAGRGATGPFRLTCWLEFPPCCRMNRSLTMTLCCWLSRRWEEPEKTERLFVSSQRQIPWSSQLWVRKGQFAMAVSEEVLWLVRGGGDAAGMSPPGWLRRSPISLPWWIHTNLPGQQAPRGNKGRSITNSLQTLTASICACG